jgi:hypothetical protein
VKKLLLSHTLLLALTLLSYSTDHHRWSIKCKPHKTTGAHSYKLGDIIKMPNPAELRMNDARYEKELIPAFSNALHLKEGDLIKVTGYMHLVALEANDDEYHVQLSTSETSGDNCFIVEVPDPKNVDDAGLKAQYTKVRSFIRNKILSGREPGHGGNVIGGRAYVTVTGQLFYDDAHNLKQVRGKKGMRSHCLWEIHPVIDMGFVREL